MSRRWKQGAVVVAVALAAAQLIRPDRANPPTHVRRTIQAQVGMPAALSAVLDRACRDCHSNGTVWPWYTRVAPVSWLMKYGVTKGRAAVNFSEWTGYSPPQQRDLLTLSCTDVTQGKMPGVYTVLHPEMRLSADDIKTVCTAAREMETKLGRSADVASVDHR